MDMHTRLKLDTALVAYDKRQAKSKNYNSHAYTQYLEALQDAIILHEVTDIPLETALVTYFNGRLLATLQKAITVTK